jgi:Mn2+/Fe2+ NRAMP family transporter
MSKLGELALGVVTSVGGFLEIGSIATAAQAGAGWGYQLVWVVALGGLCSIMLVEMSGRFAAASHHTIGAAMRERFGFDYFLIPLLSVGLVSVMVLAAEIGGVCVALELATGVAYPVWALPVGLLAWLVLWKSSFAFIEKGTSLLGLVTLAFVVAAVLVHPGWTDVLRGLVPSAPDHDRTQYWFTAVSILGASLTPYLFYFYSSGAIEDDWDASDIGINRVVATLGMGLGTLIAVAVLVLAGALFAPVGIRVEHYRQLALLLTPVLGWWGFVLTVLSLTFACLGAALEISLAVAYLVAQGLGWQWGKDLAPHEDARFSLCWTIALALGTVLIALGIDPIAMTNLSMALTALTLPVAIGPFLVLMNDRAYVGEHVNGPVGNALVMAVIALASIAAVVAMPLQLAGSG